MVFRLRRLPLLVAIKWPTKLVEITELDKRLYSRSIPSHPLAYCLWPIVSRHMITRRRKNVSKDALSYKGYLCIFWNVTGACKRQRAGSTTRPASLESRERRHIPHAPQKQPRNTHPRGYFAFLGYARSRSIDDLGGERRESGVGSLKLYLLDVYVPSQESLSLLQETGEDCYIDSCIDG